MHLLKFLGAFTFVLTVNAFDFPGEVPHDYVKGEPVDLLVSALTSYRGKLGGLFSSSYHHYDTRFHFCEPANVQQQPWSLSSILSGDRTFNSAYDIDMLADNYTCKTLCMVPFLSGEHAKFINNRIREDYALNFLIDGLPAAEMKMDLRRGVSFYDKGFPLGRFDNSSGIATLNNHYEIVLSYHASSPGNYRIISALVWPVSIASSIDSRECGRYNSLPMRLSEDRLNTVKYTYRVTWNETDTPWAIRWDRYLYTPPPCIRCFNLAKSLVVTVFLCVMVLFVLLRTMPRDISRYNAIEGSDAQDEKGWKAVHGEVFRTPGHPAVLAVMVGNGVHICATVGMILAFNFMGIRVPSDWKLLCDFLMTCWSFLGGIGGYCSSTLYISLRGSDHQNDAFLMVLVGPTIVFVTACSYNFFHISTGSSGALPFITIPLIFLLWIPSSMIGAFFGTRHGGSHQIPFNQSPRQVPSLSTYLRPWPAAVMGGIFPFVTASIDLPFLLSTLSSSHPWHGFLLLKAGAVGLTTAAMTVLFTYFILCAEEYRWHWRAFLTGGGIALWVLGYGFYYWVSFLSLDSYANTVLYLAYLFLIVFLVFLVTGAIGFLASYWVVRRLYSTIRLD